jgi:hypothetical protein
MEIIECGTILISIQGGKGSGGSGVWVGTNLCGPCVT